MEALVLSVCKLPKFFCSFSFLMHPFSPQTTLSFWNFDGLLLFYGVDSLALSSYS
jgi:hypothetical protein